MTRGQLREVGGMVVVATLLWAGTVLATTAQQKCDYARITAWRVYQSCVDSTVARNARGSSSGQFAAFAKCRHTYFGKWTGFQTNTSLAGSTCIGSRFKNNGDVTVTDNLSGLVWERKPNDSTVHDEDNVYTWSTGSPYKENGTAFTSFLQKVNGDGGYGAGSFGGANGWRLPTLTELQSIVLDFACTGTALGPTCECPSSSCIDPALGTAPADAYWSSTPYAPRPDLAWGVYFDIGAALGLSKTSPNYVRAVRGGL